MLKLWLLQRLTTRQRVTEHQRQFQVYIKPEEGVAYYTVKGVGSEDYKVEL